MNQMVNMVKIYFCIHLSFVRRVQQIRDEQKQIVILFGNIVKIAEVNIKVLSRSLTVDFVFIFSFHFIFLFYFQNNSGQGLSVMLSHQTQVDGVITRLITRLRRIEQKILEQGDVIQHGQHMLASCHTHGHLGQDAQQQARTMSSSI